MAVITRAEALQAAWLWGSRDDLMLRANPVLSLYVRSLPPQQQNAAQIELGQKALNGVNYLVPNFKKIAADAAKERDE